MRNVYSVIFLILLMLACFDHLTTGFSDIPGWHITIYPPNYIIETSIKILSLLFAVIGYIMLSKKFSKIDFRTFLYHFLLTIPAILLSLYPMEFMAQSSTVHGIESQINQTYLLNRIVFGFFVIGQTIFLVYFFRKMKLINF